MVEAATATWLIAALLRLGDCLEPGAWELGFTRERSFQY